MTRLVVSKDFGSKQGTVSVSSKYIWSFFSTKRHESFWRYLITYHIILDNKYIYDCFNDILKWNVVVKVWLCVSLVKTWKIKLT